ncbi:MAG: 4-(cytidine 5'-diphospho)-2-C-methyl-D-erythritol kinase [Clostridia bacterium]|nr:4-(cytidine 5'-diphospho)-2-C-methyl-D-erythritol kinase [Clostridia bacterium]
MRLYDDIFVSGDRAVARSYAKINLTLDVISRRENGYHDVKMIMQTLSLFDLVIVDKDKTISVSTNIKSLPTNEKNIAWKAAKLFFDETGISSGAKILIHKNIPIAAGLAGGSGNAAAVLCALDRLYNTSLSLEKLLKMGEKLGADVPFCILGGTVLAEGIGEIMTEITPIKKTDILLVKPPVSVSTQKIYEAIDSHTDLKHPDTDGMISAIDDGDLDKISQKLSNIMEDVTVLEAPEILKIKEKLLKIGAKGALMSGSGPTVYGIFENFETAKKAHDEFSKEYKETFLTKTYN